MAKTLMVRPYVFAASSRAARNLFLRQAQPTRPFVSAVLFNRARTSCTKLQAHSNSKNSVGEEYSCGNSLGSIDSPLMHSMEKKIKEHLNVESVTVRDAYGDGRHVCMYKRCLCLNMVGNIHFCPPCHFFGPTEVSTLRRFMPHHLKQCSTFELLTACIWRCRTIALHTKPHEVVRVLCIVNARAKFDPPLPTGYYGNVFAFSVALTTAGKLCENPLGYAMELVKKAKDNVTEEYMQSVSDVMVIKGRPHFYGLGSYVVSNVARAGFGEVDYGWGKSVYGGPAKGEVGAIPGVSCFQIPGKNSKGENGIMVPISLPVQAMERFVKQLDCLLKDQQVTDKKSKFIVSSL